MKKSKPQTKFRRFRWEYYNAIKDVKQEQIDNLQDLVEITKDMIKQEKEDLIDALEEQKDKYSEIVDLKKKSLELTERERTYTENVSDKNKELAKLQSRADLLKLAADSGDRESALELGSVQEQIAEKQKELDDIMRDHSLDAQKDALDQEKKDFEDTKDAEIKDIQKFLKDNEALTKAAMDRINTQGSALFDDLLKYALHYTTKTETELQKMWTDAQRAAEKYGSVVNALGTLDVDISGNGGSKLTTGQQQAIVSQMKYNGSIWGESDSAKRKELEDENVRLAKKLGLSEKNRRDGRWYWNDGTPVYHEGGEAGAAEPRSNELYALIEKGENILTKKDSSALISILRDFIPQQDFSGIIQSAVKLFQPTPVANRSSAPVKQEINIYPRDYDDFVTQFKRNRREIGNILTEQFL